MWGRSLSVKKRSSGLTRFDLGLGFSCFCGRWRRRLSMGSETESRDLLLFLPLSDGALDDDAGASPLPSCSAPAAQGGGSSALVTFLETMKKRK